MKNAIILAAGKSNRFAPFTYEKPKGLFKVKDQVLIERQIEQLLEANVKDIYVVVGYMKEKFFYLEQKYPEVKLLVNNEFSTKGNLYSLYVARQYLNNTYICCADHYFIENPFINDNENNISYRACAYIEGKFKEFGVGFSDANVITDVSIGGRDSYAMIGHGYINEVFSKRFVEILEREIDDFRIASMFWEEYFSKHIRELTLYVKVIDSKSVFEFDSIDDLRSFDTDFLMNVDSDIINNICCTLKCEANQIKDIEVIQAGLTNVSFSFVVDKKKYVYRHPGGTAGNLINRQAELFTQMKAKEVGIDKSVIYMDISGWKISHYVEEAKNCNFEENDQHLEIAMKYLHTLHSVEADNTVKIFDNIKEGKKLMKIASATKGNLEKEFSDMVDKVEKLYEYIKEDAKRLGYGLVLCHNDTYEPNYLYDINDDIYLIDWEYAGLNYDANDIGSILCRYDWSDEQIERYLKFYFGRELTEDEHRFYHSFICISGFYWFCWGLYKGSVGDDDSFFFLPAYRNTIRFIDESLQSYEDK